jgi:DNA-binding CsgD family transcriptional regulator
VRRRAGGNPLFAEELLRHALDEQLARRPASRALPLSLQGVIRERLDRADPRDHAILSAASVLGGRFRLDVLTALAGQDGDTVVAALSRLVELQLIDATDDPMTYEFRHALARDVVYGDLLPAEANALHRRAAETIEALPGAPGHAEMLAHSYWEAGLLDRAAPYCEAAGDNAMKHFAYEDAALWFERAARAFGERASDLGRVLHKASVAFNRLNEPKRAAPLYERAIAALVESGDVEPAVRTSTYLAATLYNDGRETEAFQTYDAALALAQRAGTPRLEQHVRIRRLSVHAVKHDVAGAAEQLAAIDEGALDPAERDTFEYYLSKGHVHGLRDEREARRASIARAFSTLERRGTPANEERFAHGYLAVDACALGEIDEARAHALASLEVARRIRSDVAYALSVLAEIEERAGNLRLAREAFAAMAPAPEFLHRHLRAIAAIRIGLASGDDALLRDALDMKLLREAERGGHVNTSLGLSAAYAAALARVGRRDEALELAQRFVRGLKTPFNYSWEIIAVAHVLPASAAELRAVVTAGDAPYGRLNTALCALLDALAAREAGHVARSVSCAQDAAHRFAQIGWPIAEAQSLELAGDVAGALAIYRRLGCAADVRRIERTAPASPVSVLSPRERELARLVAAGKNNREAADALSVSLKAVEKYLTSIYRKLGVTSRTQLASYIASSSEPAGASR